MIMRLPPSIAGFTLVETLVAISILLVVVVGPLTVAQKGVQNAYYANEQMMSIFYAQEALEAVRRVRDDVALDAYAAGGGDTSDWIENVHSSCTGGCTLAYDASASGNPFSSCSGGSCSAIDGTPFSRTITLGNVSAGSASLTVEVTWSSPVFGARTTALQSWVYDHYIRYESF